MGEVKNTLKVLKCAFSGKAVYNINGMTPLSALSLPVMRYNKPEILPLSASMLSNVS